MKPSIMGIINITDDSFSDGGRYLKEDKAYEHCISLISEGADILDLGGESTRPGSRAVDVETELRRIVPVLQKIHDSKLNIKVSVDTRKSQIAESAIRLGASIINDVSALRHDRDMSALLSDYPHVQVVLMHMQGEPQNMQINPQYIDLRAELMDFFEERINFCIRKGITNIILDPGIGFGKTLEHNLSILNNLSLLKNFGYPVMIGASRKNFINMICPSNPEQRLGGSLAVTAQCMSSGIDIVRVHDVKETVQFMKVFESIGMADKWNF